MMIYPQNDFARSTPEAQGLSSRAIERMLLDIRETGADIHSMLIMRHSHLVFEEYFAPYTAETKHSMFSCSKTFTSMLIGAAQDRGLLRLTDHVLDFFPDRAPENPNENLRAMTIGDLLMMGSGHSKDTFGPMLDSAHDRDADWVRLFLEQPVDCQPGTRFVYNTGATYMLSAILTAVTGKPALTLAREWLFDAMGIGDAEWETCPRGVSMGGTGLRITPRDMLKMGMLLLGRGRWKDRQLVSSAYVLEAQQKHINNRSGDPGQDPNWAAGYGYQMWRCAFDAYRADGMGGQFIVVLPKYDMICVFTSALGGDRSIGYPLDLIRKYLLPGAFALPQARDGAVCESLEKTALALSAPKPAAQPRAAESFPFDRTIELEDNPVGLRFLRVNETDIEAELGGTLIRGGYFWDAPCLNSRRIGIPFSWVNGGRVSVMARWTGDNALFLSVRYLGEPLTINLTIRAEGDGVRVSVMSTLGSCCEAKGRIL